MTDRYAFTFLVAAVAGCGVTGRYIPHDIKGDVPLAVENTWGGDICTLTIAPASAKDPMSYNVLRSTLTGPLPLKASEKATFNLKPGAYSLYVSSCERGFEGGKNVDVQGPTYLAIGQQGANPPPGYAVVNVTSGPLTECTVEGAMNDGRPCCSGRHHFDGDLHEEVCDPS
jgi:hypothetical protein